MSLISRIIVNFNAVLPFGPSFFLRHSPRLTGEHTALVSISDGTKVHLRAGESDVETVRQIFAKHQYEIGFNTAVIERVNRRYSEILEKGKVPIIVDAGANIGAASLWFAKKYNAAHIVAIEPDIENFTVLTKNAALCDRIKPFNVAIGSVSGFVEVKTTARHGWGSRTARASDGVSIMTMHQAFDTIQNGVPFIAKVDIEGFEGDLFSQNTEWLAETYVVFIEPHDWMMPGQNTSKSFQAAMGREDYEIYIEGDQLTYVRRDT